MPRDDPFAGIRLSEQTSGGKLDQRLFAPEPPIALSAKPPSPTRAAKPRVPAKSPPPSRVSSGTLPPKTPSVPAPRFDLREEPLYKASFVFTQGELEGLEDLKLELRRQLDAKVTKNSLIRAALHMLLEDHAANGQHSYASRKIKRE